MDKISVVVSCYNEEESLPLFYKEMERVRKEDFQDVEFEYIFVNGQAAWTKGGLGEAGQGRLLKNFKCEGGSI